MCWREFADVLARSLSTAIPLLLHGNLLVLSRRYPLGERVESWQFLPSRLESTTFDIHTNGFDPSKVSTEVTGEPAKWYELRSHFPSVFVAVLTLSVPCSVQNASLVEVREVVGISPFTQGTSLLYHNISAPIPLVNPDRRGQPCGFCLA